MKNIVEAIGQINGSSAFSEELLKSIDDMTRNYNYADWQYEKIMEQIRNFEQSLDENHELAIQLVSFNASKTVSGAGFLRMPSFSPIATGTIPLK